MKLWYFGIWGKKYKKKGLKFGGYLNTNKNKKEKKNIL